MAKKTKADPTGLRDRRSASTRKLRRRLKEAQKAIRKLIKNLAFTRSTEKTESGILAIIYNYSLSSEEAQSLYQVIRDIISEALLSVKNATIMPISWWWKADAEFPYRKGTVEQVNEFNKLIDEAAKAGITAQGIPIQSIPLELVLTSPSYLNGLNNVYVENFQQIKSLSDRTAAQVIYEMNNGIESGLSRRDIADSIAERFDVADSNAKRIADTEINRIYNDAKIKSAKELGEATGLNTRLMHISALTQTTRETHAARHNKLYKPIQQTRWWNTGANRINCKCTIQTVLLDKQGNVVDQELNRQIRG